MHLKVVHAEFASGMEGRENCNEYLGLSEGWCGSEMTQRLFVSSTSAAGNPCLDNHREWHILAKQSQGLSRRALTMELPATRHQLDPFLPMFCKQLMTHLQYFCEH